MHDARNVVVAEVVTSQEFELRRHKLLKDVSHLVKLVLGAA